MDTLQHRPPNVTSVPLAGKPLHGMEKQLLLVANAHMHWDPEYSDVKLVQTMMFLSEVKNIVDKATRSLKLSSVSGETNPIPLVLCADLNSLPDSGESHWPLIIVCELAPRQRFLPLLQCNSYVTKASGIWFCYSVLHPAAYSHMDNCRSMKIISKMRTRQRYVCRSMLSVMDVKWRNN